MKKNFVVLLLLSVSIVGVTRSIASATTDTSIAVTPVDSATATPVDNAEVTPVGSATVTPVDNAKAKSENNVRLTDSVENFRAYSSNTWQSSFSQYGYVGYGFNTQGSGVSRVQSFLHGFCYFVRDNKYLYDCGEIDGIWGPKTESAIIHFQQYSHLVDDGVVGPATWAEIDKWNWNHGI